MRNWIVIPSGVAGIAELFTFFGLGLGAGGGGGLTSKGVIDVEGSWAVRTFKGGCDD